VPLLFCRLPPSAAARLETIVIRRLGGFRFGFSGFVFLSLQFCAFGIWGFGFVVFFRVQDN
jgi:hypothetical protein